MVIRHATIADADAIASCLLLAMEEIIYRFINSEDPVSALAFLRHFTRQENNQYSWQNCYVAEVSQTVVGAINFYEGAALHRLRQPVVDYIHTHYNNNFFPDDETGAGEWYIDSVGVLPAQRGNGVGKALLQVVIDTCVGRQDKTLGLLVEKENAVAKRLYQHLGFGVVGNKTVFRKQMLHLQIPPCNNSNPVDKKLA